jgi:hypothetical protein
LDRSYGICEVLGLSGLGRLCRPGPGSLSDPDNWKIPLDPHNFRNVGFDSNDYPVVGVATIVGVARPPIVTINQLSGSGVLSGSRFAPGRL